jgi:hypothetical protein
MNIAQMNGKVHIYVVHPLSQPDLIQEIEYEPAEGNKEDGHVTNDFGHGEDKSDKGEGSADGDHIFAPTLQSTKHAY